MAIVPVILFHLGFQWIPGGFLGVDVFFAISGYLITSIILREVEKGVFSFSGFWSRRIRRIMPALVACIAVTMVAIYFTGYRNELGQSCFQALAALFSYSNMHTLLTAGDYWGAAAENSAFLHCWSLSTEEQFYIFFPLAFVWLIRKSPVWAFRCLLIAFVGSLGLFLIGAARGSVAAFYLLPTRAWEIAAGCIVAFLLRGKPGREADRKSAALQTVGVLAIVASYFSVGGGAVSALSILPITGAGLFLFYGDSRSGIGRVLASPPIVFIGKISYSLYLWHWPVIVVQKLMYPEMEDGCMRALVLLGITSGLSLLSYYLIETPFRNPQRRIWPILCGVAACGLTLAFASTSKNYQNYDTSAYARVRFHGPHYNVSPESPPWSLRTGWRGAGVDSREPGPGQELLYKDRGLIKQYGGERPSIMVMGDSHAVMWSSLIDSISSELKVTVSFFSVAGSNPFIFLSGKEAAQVPLRFTASQKREFDEARIRCIKEWKPLIVFSALWSNYKGDEVKDILRIAGEAGCKVLLVEQPPKLDLGDRNSAQYLAFRHIMPVPDGRVYYPKSDDGRVNEANQALRKLAAEFPFVTIVPTHDLYSRKDEAVLLDKTEIVYFDDDHLSDYGTRLAKGRIESAIREGLMMKSN